MYPWLVSLHLLGLIVFIASHGVSMFVAFRIRGERDRGVVRTLLALSARATQVMYVGLLALAIGGLGAAGVGNLLTAPWVVASYVVVGVVLGVMYGAGSGFYVRLRQGLDGTDTVPRLDDDALAARLASRRPELLAATGMTGIVLLVLLMVLKPIPG